MNQIIVNIRRPPVTRGPKEILYRRVAKPPALLAILLFLTSLGSARADNSVSFGDYPRYGTDVNALHPTVQAGMKAFAAALVGTVLAGQSIDVMVIGHADFDAKGTEFEVGVSRERAAGAESALETFFSQAANAAALPADRRKLVRFTAIGVGTQRPVNSKPVNEEQRKANRRVELVFTTRPVPPPDPRERFQNCVRVLANAGPPGPIRRMTCVCNKLLQPTPSFVKDYHYDFQAARSLRSGAGAMSQFTAEQMSAFYRGFMRFVRKDIASMSTTSDESLANDFIQLDDTIGRNLTDFLGQAELGAGPFEHSVSTDIVKRMTDPNHIYSCYAGYSRRDPNR